MHARASISVMHLARRSQLERGSRKTVPSAYQVEVSPRVAAVAHRSLCILSLERQQMSWRSESDLGRHGSSLSNAHQAPLVSTSIALIVLKEHGESSRDQHLARRSHQRIFLSRTGCPTTEPLSLLTAAATLRARRCRRPVRREVCSCRVDSRHAPLDHATNVQLFTSISSRPWSATARQANSAKYRGTGPLKQAPRRRSDSAIVSTMTSMSVQFVARWLGIFVADCIAELHSREHVPPARRVYQTWRKRMMKGTLCGGLIALSVFVAASASASPTGLDGTKSGAISAIEKAAWHHCWWRDGVRYCRWYRGWGYGPRWYRGWGYGPGWGWRWRHNYWHRWW